LALPQPFHLAPLRLLLNLPFEIFAQQLQLVDFLLTKVYLME